MPENKVCIITTVHAPFDGRIFHKEGKSLQKKGHNVTLIAPHSGDETVDGIKIVALPKAANRFMRIFGLGTISLFLALREKADIYHFHDPELLVMGLLLKMFSGKKIIYDVHEDYSAAIHNKYWLPPFLRSTVALMFDIVENLCAGSFDGIIAATPEIARKFPALKTFVIRNLPVYEMIYKTSPLNIKKGKPVLIYAGSLSYIRGIKEIIQAAGLLEGMVQLWLIGEWETEEYKNECEMLRGWQFVSYFGIKKLNEVYAYMKTADIGLHCIYQLPRYQKGLPIKYFEYMACGIPAILSGSNYWEELFHNCALFVDPRSPEDIAEKVMRLISDKGLREGLIENGKKLIDGEYNWETESRSFLESYEGFMGRDHV